MARPHEVFPFSPNWKEAVRETHEFRTEMITSRSGREQRRALRLNPRRSFEYTTLLANGAQERFSHMMATRQEQAFLAPHPTDFVLLSSSLSAAATTTTVDQYAGWISPGVTLIISGPNGEAEALDVTAYAHPTIQFDKAPSRRWDLGSRLHAAVWTRLTDSIRSMLYTNNVGVATVRHDLEPGLNAEILAGTAPTSWNGRELFTMKPDWAERPQLDFETTRELLDYGFGRKHWVIPRDFNTRTLRLTFVGRTKTECAQIVQFFHRMKGQQGEFYMASPNQELTAIASITAGGTTLKIAGTDYLKPYDTKLGSYPVDPVNCNVAVRLKNGTVLYRKIASLQGTDAPSSAELYRNTIINITGGAWGVSAAPADILSISWLPVWRCASDTLTIEWITSSVAQFVIPMRTLEDLTGA